MADDDPQVEEETSWWAVEGFADSDLPSMSIDEPLEWPDASPWEEFSGNGAEQAPLAEPADLIFPVDAAPEAPAGQDQQWQAGDDDPEPTVAAATALGGLGGDAPGPAPGPASEATVAQPLPESIWSFDGLEEPDDQVEGLTTLAGPLVYADSDGGGRGRWPRHLDIRRGNVAVVALISAVSLVLLGMFLSVRSRNDLPTDATASPPRTDQIATANTRNLQPSTSVATTTTVAGAINIADLVPTAEAAAADTGASDGGGTGTTGRTPVVATTAPARSNPAPAGGAGGSTGTTQAAPQSTATTAAPEPPVLDTTPPTAPPPPPVDDTTAITRPRTSTPPPTFTMPSVPDYTIPDTRTSIPRFSDFTVNRNDS